MFSFLAVRMAVRKRGFESASPPPTRAAMVISRISFVKMRPRLASVAAFLCLIVAHLECPDMGIASSEQFWGLIPAYCHDSLAYRPWNRNTRKAGSHPNSLKINGLRSGRLAGQSAAMCASAYGGFGAFDSGVVDFP